MLLEPPLFTGMTITKIHGSSFQTAVSLVFLPQEHVEVFIHMDQQENMGLELLGERFGGRITFFSPVDIQTAMQRPLPDIRAYARSMARRLARPEGGFIPRWYTDPADARLTVGAGKDGPKGLNRDTDAVEAVTVGVKLFGPLSLNRLSCIVKIDVPATAVNGAVGTASVVCVGS